MRLYLLILAAACALFFAFPFSPPVWAQMEKEPTPSSVLAAMEPGGVSLRYLALPVGAAGISARAHLYVVPPKKESPEGKPKGTPFTRADMEGTLLPPSLFVLDIFIHTGGKMVRRSTIPFHQQFAPSEIQIGWRDSRQKRGLVLMLMLGTANSGVWDVFALDDTLRPIGIQSFGYTQDHVEPDYHTDTLFDQTDAHGIMAVTVQANAGTTKQTFRYDWIGTGFVDKQAAYFVFAAITKTRREAEAFASGNRLESYEIISTSDYKKLAPHRYAVVLNRFRDEKEADDFVRSWQAAGKNYTTKQAF